MIVVGDIHAKRIEPFRNAINNFFEWLVDNYKDEEVLFLGDLNDNSSPHGDIEDLIASYLIKFKKVKIIVGNHDISKKQGNSLLHFRRFKNVEVYNEPVAEERCLFLPHKHNIEEYKSLEQKNIDIVFSHLTHPKEAFGEEGIDLSYLKAKLYIYGHTHIQNQYDNHIILGVPCPTRHGEQNQNFRIMKINSPAEYEFIDVPQIFTYRDINYGEFPENKNDIITVVNAPSYNSVHTEYKEYYVRGIKLQENEDIETEVSLDLNKNSIKSEFILYSKKNDVSKDVTTCCLKYLDSVEGE